MTKVLILNVGWLNKGNVALVQSTMNAIKQFVPCAEFSLIGPEELTFFGLQVKEQAGTWFTRRKPPYCVLYTILYLFECVCINICIKFGLNFPISKKSKLFEYYDCDIVINSGGDHLSGEGGIGTLGSFINILYALLLNKPVVLFGESLGYFKSPILNCIAQSIFNKTKLILVRETISKYYLDKNKITKPDIYVTADPAFLLNPISQKRVIEILQNEGIIELPSPLIGINPSGLISRFGTSSSPKNEAYYVDVISNVIEEITERLDATIILIPHVYTKNVDDRTIMYKIFKQVSNPNVKMIHGEYNPEELKGIIGRCDMFVGSRMHSTIASTSMLVPTVGIAYSHKMHGIIGEMLEQEKYVLDISELNYDNLVSIINDAWNNRGKIKKDLDKKIPILKEKALLNGMLVKNLIDSEIQPPCCEYMD